MSKVLFFASFVAVGLALPCLLPAQAPSPQAVEERQAAVARAGEYRTKAGDFEAASYFPSDWAAAEALYAEAALMPTGSAGDVDRSTAAFNAAADSFSSILRLTIPLYAQAREDEIMMLRDALVAGGARALFPGLVRPADRAALAALDRYGAGDYYAARDYADRAHAMFQVLETAFTAWRLRREIVQRGFMDYAQDNFERAEAIIEYAMRAHFAGDFPLAFENAVEAQARYSLVLSSGWAALAEYYSTAAKGKRVAAVDVRANVAARDIFEEADGLYGSAADSLRREYYREAAMMFADAGALYLVAKVSTLERRRLAAEAIMEANRHIEEIIRAAERAELDAN